jgi:WD40 repeat protein
MFGSDGTIELWDARTGELIGEPLYYANRIRSVALGTIDGVPVIVSGSFDTGLRRWNAHTGEPIGERLEGHTNVVNSVTLGAIDGAPVIVSGGHEGTVRRWNARTGEPIGEPLEGHTSVSSVALGAIDGAPVIVSREDLTIRCSNARTGEPICEPLEMHLDWTTSVALGAIDGVPILVLGARNGTIRCWNARTGEIGEELKGNTGWFSVVAALKPQQVWGSGSGSTASDGYAIARYSIWQSTASCARCKYCSAIQRSKAPFGTSAST